MKGQRLFDHHGATDFDWAAVEDDADADKTANGIVVGVISFVLAFVFSGTAKPETAFRRFLAITYIIRPDLLGNKSQGEIADELGVFKSEVARHVGAVRDELQLEGSRLIGVSARLRIKAGQLAARERGIAARKKGSSRRGSASIGVTVVVLTLALAVVLFEHGLAVWLAVWLGSVTIGFSVLTLWRPFPRPFGFKKARFSGESPRFGSSEGGQRRAERPRLEKRKHPGPI